MDPKDARAQGRAALIAGHQNVEVPPGDGGRWGVSVIFRLSGTVLQSAVELAEEVSAVAGPGHWVHGPLQLHTTAHSLEPRRSVIPDADPLVSNYRKGLADAAAALPVPDMEFRGLNPHPGGVALAGHPLGDAANRFRERLWEILGPGVYRGRASSTIMRWHLNLAHFAAPIADAARLVAWCDERAELSIGSIRLEVAELVEWRWDGGRMQPDVLHSAVLGA